MFWDEDTHVPTCQRATCKRKTDPTRAHVTRLAPDRWQIAWEDWQDGDFNDSVVLVEMR